MVETNVVNETTTATVYGRFDVDTPEEFEDDDWTWTGFDQCCCCPVECCYAVLTC